MNIRMGTVFHPLQTNGNQEDQGTRGLLQGNLSGITGDGQPKAGKIASGSSIYAGKQGLESDSIAERKALAQKRALKAVMDVYKEGASTDDMIRESRSRSEDYKELAKQAEAELAHTREAREYLKEVSSPEEYEELSREYDTMEATWNNRIEMYKSGVSSENQAEVGIKLELLKSHPMVDAAKTADSIMEAASKEAAGMLYDQIKENLDTQQEQNEEKTEKLKEKKEEEKERIESSREEEAVIPENVEEIQKAAQTQDTVRQQIKKVMEEGLVLEEDLKGLGVDETL